MLQYPSECHHKNIESMKRMCAVYGLTYEITNDIERLDRHDYQYLWLPSKWVDLDNFPSTIKILVGPTHFEFPKGPLCGPRVDKWSNAVFTSVSEWHKKMFSEFTDNTVIRVEALPFGVSLPIDNPIKKSKDYIILYTKYCHSFKIDHIKYVLESKGLAYKHFSYGLYKDSEYKEALSHASFCIWIGCTETQGFAFQECLASGTPILCLDAESMFDTVFQNNMQFYGEYIGKKKLLGTTCSWWSDKCGLRFTDVFEFEEVLEKMLESYETYDPVSFIQENLTDEVCIKRIINSFENVNNLSCAS
jgi:glycosyltransferase involved in cell wall biosynthesis